MKKFNITLIVGLLLFALYIAGFLKRDLKSYPCKGAIVPLQNRGIIAKCQDNDLHLIYQSNLTDKKEIYQHLLKIIIDLVKVSDRELLAKSNLILISLATPHILIEAICSGANIVKFNQEEDYSNLLNMLQEHVRIKEIVK